MKNATTTRPTATVKVPQNPTQCPICHVTQVPFQVSFHFDLPRGYESHTKKLSSEEHRVERVYKCVNKDCERLFIALYHGRVYGREWDYSDVRLLPFEGDVSLAKELTDFSPKFAKIVSQAYIAQYQGLTEVAGPGFRKALETLVRDYSLRGVTDADVVHRIKTGNLGKVIVEFIDDKYVREAAQRATWLGNDESHYEDSRLWEGKDLDDLMHLLGLTMSHIVRTEQHLKMMKEMPQGKTHAATAPTTKP